MSKIEDVLAVIKTHLLEMRDEVRDELIGSLGGRRQSPNGKAPKNERREKQARNFPPHCVYPGCKNPHKGPRFSFLCDKHKGISKAERTKVSAAFKRKK